MTNAERRLLLGLADLVLVSDHIAPDLLLQIKRQVSEARHAMDAEAFWSLNQPDKVLR